MPVHPPFDARTPFLMPVHLPLEYQFSGFYTYALF